MASFAFSDGYFLLEEKEGCLSCPSLPQNSYKDACFLWAKIATLFLGASGVLQKSPTFRCFFKMMFIFSSIILIESSFILAFLTPLLSCSGILIFQLLLLFGTIQPICLFSLVLLEYFDSTTSKSLIFCAMLTLCLIVMIFYYQNQQLEQQNTGSFIWLGQRFCVRICVGFSCMVIISYMPGKDIIVLVALITVIAARNYPLYKQCDSRWGSEQLGTSSNTICSAGCLMSSAAMGLSAVGSSQTPSTLNTWLKGHGGYVSQDLFVWASINPLGVRFAGFISNSAIQKNIKEDNIVIVNVHNGGHWVLVTSMLNSNTVAVNDPGYSTTSYTLSQIVEGNTGMYRVGNSLMGMMIGELEMMFNVGGVKKKLIDAAKGILEQ